MQEIIDKIDLLQNEDKHEEIIQFIEELFKDDKYKGDFELIGYIGRALNNLQRTEEAREIFFSIQEQGKNDIKWNYRVAFSYYIEDKHEETVKYTLEALRLIKEQNWNVNNIQDDAIEMLSWAYNQMGRYQDNLDLLMEYKKEDISWYLDVADIYLKLENYSEAAVHLEKAKEAALKNNDDRNLELSIKFLIKIYQLLEKYDKVDKIKEDYPQLWEKIYNDAYSYYPEEKEAVLNYLEENFGEYYVIKDEDEDFPKVELLVFPPNEERNHYVVSTVGMGHSIMRSMPEELLQEGYGRLELLVALPKDWDIYSTEPEYTWPLEWLKLLAKWPFRSDIWLGWGHTIPNGEPFAKNTKLFCMILLDPVEYAPELTLHLESGERISFLQMIPIYEEEMEYKIQNRAEGLIKLFGENFSNVVNIKRKNYAMRFGFAGSNKGKWSNRK